MKRKVFYSIALCVGFLGMISCGKGGIKEKKVKEFADDFARYVNGGEMDSIKAVYPAANFDSVTPVLTDSISVAENGGGVYKVNFSAGKWIEVNVGEDGKMTVVSSKGVAAFPADKYDIAKNTGMITDSINDVKAHELLNDNAYFEWLNRKYMSNSPYTIKISPGKTKSIWREQYGEGFKGSITITLTNMSDNQISGSDYSISYTSKIADGRTEEPYASRSYTYKKTIKGKDLGPKGTDKITISDWLAIKYYDFKIVPAKGKEDLLEFSYTPSGNEYQEYLQQSSGKSQDTGYDWLSTRKVTHNDLEDKTPEELRIMRNWIYARHGYIFKSPELAEYFSQFSWYEPKSRDVSYELNKIEKSNVETLKAYE